MSIDWSTFVLEIVNFLVLLWILQRFLYRPVLAVIARRRADIEKTLTEARTREAAATALEARYQGRLDAWERERESARAALQQQLDAERVRQLAALSAELQRERDKARAADARRLDESRQQLERTAVANGARFAARLLSAAAGPDTEARLIDLAVAGITALSPERLQDLRGGRELAAGAAHIATAHELDAAHRAAVLGALARVAGREVTAQVQRDPQLIAGVRIVLGDWSLGANVADELQAFAQLADGA
jgi:F-type H+-transporting ATPase subunit b